MDIVSERHEHEQLLVELSRQLVALELCSPRGSLSQPALGVEDGDIVDKLDERLLRQVSIPRHLG